MEKKVILITGTPCVGKTTLAIQLVSRIGGLYINLTDLAKKENLVLREDAMRNSLVVNEDKMRKTIAKIVKETDKSSVVVDGHYAAVVTPKGLVSKVLVLRRDPRELRVFMTKCGFSPAKMSENLEAEVLDVCLVEALRENKKSVVCEVDVTGKTTEQSLDEVMGILDNRKTCCVGVVDWLGVLESAGILDDYLRV
jgi:adenylate kinase